MRIPRLYINVHPVVTKTLTLGSEQSRYLTQVLRLRIGQQLRIFDGLGSEFLAEVQTATKGNCGIRVLEHLLDEAAPELRIHLNLAIAKGERMDFALQKSVELGASVIQPLYSARSVVAMDSTRDLKRVQRWRNIVISACEQSGRCHLPEVLPPRDIGPFLADEYQGTAIILHPDAALALGDLAPSDADIHLLVGPEGGLTAHEVEAAVAQGYQPIRLGPRILRTETAPLAAIAAIQTLWGDYR